MSDAECVLPAVVVVGSTGKMGSMFVRRFSEAGISVRTIDGLHEQPPTPDKLQQTFVAGCVVMLCIPVDAVRTVLRQLTPFMPADAVLTDITSVKVRPMQVMEEEWPGAVVGTHPLFGPTSVESDGLSVAITTGAQCAATQLVRVERLFQAVGCHTFRCSPEEHDAAMAAIQGLNFISSVAYFATLAHDASLLPFLTPSFRRRQEAAKKLLTEDAVLFEGIFEANPYSQALVRKFRSFLNVAAGGDVSLLVQRAAWWWEADAPSETTSPDV